MAGAGAGGDAPTPAAGDYLRRCLAEVVAGNLQAVSLDDLAPHLRALGPSGARRLLAEALAPGLAALRAGAGAADRGSSRQWAALEFAAGVVAELTAGERWGGPALAAAVRAAAARALVAGAGPQGLRSLWESKVAALSRYRADPEALSADALGDLQGTLGLLAEAELEAPRLAYAAEVRRLSSETARRSAAQSLQGLALGGVPEGWVARFSRAVRIEQSIDAFHEGLVWEETFRSTSRLAPACASAWLHAIAPVLPWLVAWAVAPAALEALRGREGGRGGGDTTRRTLTAFRSAANASHDPDALRLLESALVSGLTLLLRLRHVPPALSAFETVLWAAAVLAAAHVACEALLREVAPATLAAALSPCVAKVCNTSGREGGDDWTQPPPPAPWGELPPFSAGEAQGTAAFRVSAAAPQGLALVVGWDPPLRLALAAAQLGSCPAGLAEGDVPGALTVALHLALAAHGEAAATGATEGGLPCSVAPLQLLFHLLGDAPVVVHAGLAGLRVLRAQGRAEDCGAAPGRELRTADSEERFVRFLSQECGAANRTLRQLRELRRDVASRGLLRDDHGPWQAVVCHEVAASTLGLRTLSDGIALGAPTPPLFDASRQLLIGRTQWAAQYTAKFEPHRRLMWRPLLGSTTVCWRHARGRCELLASELQAHVLLVFNDRREVAEADVRASGLAWEVGANAAGDGAAGAASEGECIAAHWARACEALCGPMGPLERRVTKSAKSPEAVLRAKDAPDGGGDGEDPIHVDPWPLAALLGACSSRAGAEDRGGKDAEARAPAVDAAVVRLLKRWRVLTAAEIVEKLASYPYSLELSASVGTETNTAATIFAAARSGAAQDGAEALARAGALCERNFLRREPESGGSDAADHLTRYFYVD